MEIVKDGDDHVAKFDGSSYLTLLFDSVGFPYTVTFDLLIEEQDEESIVLFDGKDGTLYLNYDGTGKIGYERKGLSYLFDQEIETGRWQNITIVCDRSNAKLYIDQVYSGSGQYYQVDAERQSSSTFVLPVETVGAGFKGCLDDLVIYDEALTIVNPDNLAQNKPVTVSGVEVPDRMLGPDAVDGDPATRWSASPEGAEQWLIVDLEEQVDIGRIYLNFQEPPRYEIQVSADGENFTTVLKVGDGVTDGSTVERSYDLDGITARYVKILQLERFVGDYYGMGIYELEVYSDQADKTALQQLIETCSTYEADEYISVSWETFHSALDEAIAVLEKEDAEQSEINDAAAKLTSAMDALQVKASTSAIQALRNMVDKANALGSDDEALNNAIETAQALLNDSDNASVTAVVSALLELSEAMQALNMDESIDALRADVQATIDFINENILNNVEGIRPGRVQALKDAVAAAEELLANPDASADELKAVNKAMTKAAQELWEIVAKAELNALIEAVNGYLDGDYTAESLEALQAAIEAAQAVANNDDATTAEVTEAITNLSNAIAGLESITLDTSALEYEIELVTEMLANLDDYIASSVEGLQEKLDAAKETLENATSQAEIDEATKTLREARLNARTKADVSALEELIAYAKSLDLSAYTTESAQAVIQTLARAEQMTNDPEITQEEVNDMVKELQASVDELIEVNESANAADTTNTAAMNTVNMMFILMLAAGAAAAMAYRRKRS
ncbi:MAG: discoidin domain-containing protein [Merdibacter sp.]